MSRTGRVPSLIPYLAEAKLDVRLFETCREAHAFLCGGSRVDLVVTGVSLPDGNWCDMVRHVVECTERVSIVVASAAADERFWSEILRRGVYDLLLEPFDPSEVKRVIEGAMRVRTL
jgi:DNA-binding NtrC family response regulator